MKLTVYGYVKQLSQTKVEYEFMRNEKSSGIIWIRREFFGFFSFSHSLVCETAVVVVNS